MTNPFTFKYPPFLVEWFAALTDRVRSVAPQTAEELVSTERMLKSGERMRDGFVRRISFSDRGGIYPYSDKCISLEFASHGFGVSEVLRDQGARSACVRFAWNDVDCAVCRHYVGEDAGRREEVKEIRGVCGLKTCLDGLTIDRLADAAIAVEDVREWQAVRSAAELGRALSERFASKREPCRLQSRDGAVRVRLTSDPESGGLTVVNEVTGEVCRYAALSDLAVHILPGLFNKGLLVIDGGQS